MSYNQWQTFSNVSIESSKIIPLAQHIAKEAELDIFNDFENCKKQVQRYLSDCDWCASFDDQGNCYEINFDNDRARDYQEECLNLIAPFIKKGTFIQMQGEDDCLWRWVFNGEKCIQDYPEIKWQDPETF